MRPSDNASAEAGRKGVPRICIPEWPISRKKVLSQLQKWYPQVNAFETRLRPYDEQLKLLQQNETILRYNETQAQWALHDQRLENQSLAYELQEYRDFIDSIPQEIFEELKARYEMSEQLQQQQEM